MPSLRRPVRDTLHSVRHPLLRAIINTIASKTSIGFIAAISLVGAVITTATPAFSSDLDAAKTPQTLNESSEKMKAGDLREDLLSKGYVAGESKIVSGEEVTSYSVNVKKLKIEFLVPENDAEEVDVSFPQNDKESGLTPRKVNFGWDNGPRLYMTGTDFWNLGATGVKEVCGKLPAGSGPCSDLVDSVWEDILTGPGKPLNDGTCYDLSQTLNVGWEKVDAKKCK